MECIWSVYADFLQRKLDEAKNEWNLHTIRYTDGRQDPGIPNQLYYVLQLKGYATEGHQFSEADIVNTLQRRNFEEEFEQIMKGSKSHLQEYFHNIASIQRMSPHPSDWENQKKYS